MFPTGILLISISLYFVTKAENKDDRKKKHDPV